ncbi:MAG: tRNA (N(6)-L-threonylcarbamoyladenosine(37)-C(2))-methylthiotransferase MtaB [Candidatus Marinamargulisbacteria bacterium]
MRQNNTFAMISQGCRLNHSETASLANEFKANGLNEVALDHNPQLVVVNTCTVTENGDKDTLKLIRKINDACSDPQIALIGCQSQIKKDDLLTLSGVRWVIGNESKEKTADLILSNNTGVHVNKFKKKSFSQPYSSFDPKHTRVNLKIQDGCDFYCSFCIIPFARGPARSRDAKNILDDAKALIHLGVKELVLTGINLGTYQNRDMDFYYILTALLSLNPDTRIRISSIEPTTIDERLIQLWHTYPNFCRYLHLPIQSATDEILTKMRRKYTLNEYAQFMTNVHSALPGICIGTDIIVGFPGETDDLFDQTYDFLNRSPIHYFHVFRYSERQMAHSRKFSDPVSPETLKKRSAQLRQLHTKKWHDYMKSKCGDTVKVLFEQRKLGDWVGATDHFIKVKVTSSDPLKNQFRQVRLTGVSEAMMTGELV